MPPALQKPSVDGLQKAPATRLERRGPRKPAKAGGHRLWTLFFNRGLVPIIHAR